MSTVSFILTGAPLPSNFRGTPQQFFEAMLARMKVQTPFGITGLVLNPTVLPSSDKGPVLFNRSWYVWNYSTNQYEPADISPSVVDTAEFSATQPTDVNIVTWYELDGSTIVNVWVKYAGVFQPLFPTTGPTVDRPASPRDFQQYYDTDIDCMIHWERGQWRTVSGVRGDVKHVVWSTAELALLRNPGWGIIGESSMANSSTWTGRALVQASKNADGSHPLSVGAGITRRTSGEVFGVEEVQLVADNVDHVHAMGLWGNVDINASDNVRLSVREQTDTPGPLTVPAYKTGQVEGGGASGNVQSDTTANVVTQPVVEFAGTPVENQQPTLALWTLVKE